MLFVVQVNIYFSICVLFACPSLLFKLCLLPSSSTWITYHEVHKFRWFPFIQNIIRGLAKIYFWFWYNFGSFGTPIRSIIRKKYLSYIKKKSMIEREKHKHSYQYLIIHVYCMPIPRLPHVCQYLDYHM